MLIRRLRYISFFIIVGCATSNLFAQDITQLGGDVTSLFTGRNAIQLPAPNVASEENRLLQLSGFAVFHQFANKAEGLGPTFNHVSCGSCHVNNGRGRVNFLPSSIGSPMVIKISLPGLNSDGSPKDVPGIGEQLRDHQLQGKRLFDIKLQWTDVEGSYPDGTTYTLRKPKLSFLVPGYKSHKLRPSLRMAPPVIGPGLLEAIPESTILALSDPSDSNGDGISGKPQYVPDIRTNQKKLGRFGFKSSHPTLEQQSAAAAFHDIGLTNILFNTSNNSDELSQDELNRLSVYQQIAGVPAATNQSDPKVIKGKGLFVTIGCEDCHKMTLVTGTHEFSELSNQTIHPFTDLLLHNMGLGLADKRSEFEASGAEWRTTPLWGLGFSETLSNVKANFLHDGRARSIEEAILWHAGEGNKSRKNFKNLAKSDRKALIAFLRSL
ncbi:MAG: di-heme oxidoredictase family protein [bacterium]|nr:di-heme oxidoredictase family protein [bacterium]